MRVTVVGAGVSGLTCAIALRDAGFDARIVARDEPLSTVSAVAAALWYPLRGEMDGATRTRMERSHAAFLLLTSDPVTGVILRDGIEIFRDEVPSPEWWTGRPTYARSIHGHAIAFAWEKLPVIEMPVYLEYLRRRLLSSDGEIEERGLSALEDVPGDVVVNCAGLGAMRLAGDTTMFPVRGQVVRVQNLGIDRFILDEFNPAGRAYIVPRTHDVVCGGTREEGATSMEPDPETERAILERCIALEPRLEGAPIVSRAVGLRPGRSHVRLEAESIGGRTVIHNYGHTGSGVTLSWGCAHEVVSLVEEAAVGARSRH